jgi:hypothetical protein
MRSSSVLIALFIVGRLALAQDLPFPRRLLVLTLAFLESAELRDPPPEVPGDKSRVLVLFRVAEGGFVLDARAVGGSEKARAAAVLAVKAWRFGPTLLGSQPVQMQSGALFDFSSTPTRVQAPSPMSAEQISPVLSNRCFFAISKGDPEPAATCSKEAQAVEKNHNHTAAESIAAHDELGVALLRFSKDPRQAFEEFSRSIELATNGFAAFDGEMAQLYWHRAEALRELNRTDQASADFILAAKTFEKAAGATPKAGSWYRTCSDSVIKQHASMLETSGKHDEAVNLLKTLKQEE